MPKTISIIGTSITDIGELWDRELEDLLIEAVTSALADAHLEPTDIEAIFIANKAACAFSNQTHLNALVSQLFPHFPSATRVEAACASGGVAMEMAENALLAERYKTVLVVGVEKMTDVSASKTTRVLSSAAHLKQEYGSTFPALYSLLAQMHMQNYGTTREQLAQVAVKNHFHALQNPHAQFHKEISIKQVINSPLVADPLRVFDCSPISDGAAAVILTTNPTQKAPQILGVGHGQDFLDLAQRESLTSLDATRRAAKIAYQMAGLTPQQIQVAEVHDCFTIGEILAIEDLGFFAAGEGGPATLHHQTTSANSNANIIINPSGGLKASGHPVGATGVKQIAYMTQLLKTQKYDCGLTHNVGGSGGTAVVHILANPGFSK